MLSGRTRWDLAPNRLSERLAARRHAGAEILDLTASNPTRAGFDYDEAAISATLADPRVVAYEPSPRGAEPARRAIADYYAARGVTVDPDAILLTTSTSEAGSII